MENLKFFKAKDIHFILVNQYHPERVVEARSYMEIGHRDLSSYLFLMENILATSEVSPGRS